MTRFERYGFEELLDIYEHKACYDGCECCPCWSGNRVSERCPYETDFIEYEPTCTYKTRREEMTKYLLEEVGE